MSSKKKWKAAAASRDAGGFVAMPWVVLDSPAYQALSHPARGLLMEFARQYVRDNNGMLLASGTYLAKRGWTSNAVITRAKKELIDAGFIFETVKGHRPNKASLYAVTWATLDHIDGFDPGARSSFQRGAYRTKTAPLPTTTQPKKTMKKPPNQVTHGYVLTPPDGAKPRFIAPPDGVESAATAPPDGAIKGVFCHFSTPPDGDLLEIPSTDDQGEVAAATREQQKTASTLHGKHDGGVADQGCYLRLRPNPERLFTGLPGLDAVVRPEAAAAPQREGGYLRLALKPKRLFTGLLLAEHQRAPEQVMQLAVQRAAQAARKAVAP